MDLYASVRRRIIALQEYKYAINQENKTISLIKCEHRLVAISTDKYGVETIRVVLPKEGQT